jgi:DNA-binding response OmpR family regulator
MMLGSKGLLTPLIPIIFLTASDEEVSIIRGLDCGGDDYITKPFKLGELCSRIRALLRRAGLSNQSTVTVMECGDIKIDLLGSRVLLKGKTLELTAAEYRLICLLVKNANHIITIIVILAGGFSKSRLLCFLTKP